MSGIREETKEAMNRKEVKKKKDEGEEKKRKKGPDDSFKDENLKKSRNQGEERKEENNIENTKERRVSFKEVKEVFEYDNNEESERTTKKRKETDEDDICNRVNKKRGKTTNIEEQKTDESVNTSDLSNKSESEIMMNIVPNIISEEMFEMFREKCNDIVESESCIIFLTSAWILFAKNGYQMKKLMIY